MKNKTKEKYVPIAYGFDDYNDDKDSFYCYYVKGTYNKYGLKYVDDTAYNCEPEAVHLKGKKYGKAPFAYNSYEEMITDSKKRREAFIAAERAGNIKKEAVFLILDLDEDGILHSDPCDFDGYVTKHGTIFRITGDGNYDGKKWFKLTNENRHLVFSDIIKAANYIQENYGDWAMWHYLKNRPGNF